MVAAKCNGTSGHVTQDGCTISCVVQSEALQEVMVLAKKLGQDSYFQGASSACFICGTFRGEFPDQ